MYSLRRKLYTNYTLNPTLRRFKPYTASIQNPTQRAFKTLHCERSQNYIRSGTQTLHFVFEHESREWNLEHEWSGSYVTFVTNVTNETNVTNVTNVKQEMAIGGDAPRHSLRLFISLTLCLFISLTLCLFDSSSLCLFLSPSRRFVTPARRSKKPTILSEFSAIRH